MPHCSHREYRFSEAQRRLLYVGSDLALLKFLRSAFSKPNYHVVSCPDRRSAEMFIESQIRYELFIFDLNMRDRAAFDLTRLVRSLNHRERTAVLVVGGEGDASVGEFTRATGGNEYVEKGDHFEAIHQGMKRLLRQSLSESVESNFKSGTASRPNTGS